MLHGTRTYLHHDEAGNAPTHSISAGLDYPVGPEHRCCATRGPRAPSVEDGEALGRSTPPGEEIIPA